MQSQSIVQRIGTFFYHVTLMNAVRMYACAQRSGHRQIDQEGDNGKQRLGEEEKRLQREKRWEGSKFRKTYVYHILEHGFVEQHVFHG